jgi:hypothetical protein
VKRLAAFGLKLSAAAATFFPLLDLRAQIALRGIIRAPTIRGAHDWNRDAEIANAKLARNGC